MGVPAGVVSLCPAEIKEIMESFINGVALSQEFRRPFVAC